MKIDYLHGQCQWFNINDIKLKNKKKKGLNFFYIEHQN